MNHSLVTADRTTHLKIVAVSLVAAIAFAFLAADTTDPGAAQSALDRTASALAACGCG